MQTEKDILNTLLDKSNLKKQAESFGIQFIELEDYYSVTRHNNIEIPEKIKEIIKNETTENSYYLVSFKKNKTVSTNYPHLFKNNYIFISKNKNAILLYSVETDRMALFDNHFNLKMNLSTGNSLNNDFLSLQKSNYEIINRIDKQYEEITSREYSLVYDSYICGEKFRICFKEPHCDEFYFYSSLERDKFESLVNNAEKNGYSLLITKSLIDSISLDKNLNITGFTYLMNEQYVVSCTNNSFMNEIKQCIDFNLLFNDKETEFASFQKVNDLLKSINQIKKHFQHDDNKEITCDIFDTLKPLFTSFKLKKGDTALTNKKIDERNKEFKLFEHNLHKHIAKDIETILNIPIKDKKSHYDSTCASGILKVLYLSNQFYNHPKIAEQLEKQIDRIDKNMNINNQKFIFKSTNINKNTIF